MLTHGRLEMLAFLLYLCVRVEPQHPLRNCSYTDKDILMTANQSQHSSKKPPSKMVQGYCQLRLD